MYRQWYEKLDFPLILATLALILWGFVTIYSTTFRESGGGSAGRQLFSFCLGLLLSLPVLLLDYRSLTKIRFWIYGLTLLLLLGVLIVGHEARGAQRWISLGPLGTFQPSELAKLGLILFFACHLATMGQAGVRSTLKGLGSCLMLAGVPTLLILMQPDLGTAMTVAAILSAIFLAGGVPLLLLLAIGGAGIGALSKLLKPYQIKRLLVFLDPYSDPRGGGWNIIQSLIAVGSGGLTGKGYLSGTQTQLKFVPEHSTDFIFTAVGEEMGFLGALLLLALYLVVIFRGLRIAREAGDPLGRLIAIGITTMFLFHVFVNIGMTIAIMPITGIPLPFMSFGGSSLITGMIGIALLVSIDMRKDRILP